MSVHGGTIPERFWAMVNKTASCWEWTGYKNAEGYGAWTSPELGGTRQVHRITYAALVGEIPNGLVIDHLCRNRACCNPDHLEPVTSRENSRRSPLVLKEACSKGHTLQVGSYYEYLGSRICKACQIERVKKAQAGRSTQTYVCEFCGETRNLSARSKHLKRWHPEHYEPKRPTSGMTDERRERRNETQRLRRQERATGRTAS